MIATIEHAWLGISKSKPWKGQPFYYLEVTQPNLLVERKEAIYVFPNLVSQEIWQTLEKENYRDQQYLLICEKRTRGWRLKEWKELSQSKNENKE